MTMTTTEPPQAASIAAPQIGDIVFVGQTTGDVRHQSGFASRPAVVLDIRPDPDNATNLPRLDLFVFTGGQQVRFLTNVPFAPFEPDGWWPREGGSRTVMPLNRTRYEI
jgi:hypothetical protein